MTKALEVRSIYQRLADARHQFHQLELKKSGRNKFAGYEYFELGDILVPGMNCLREHGLVPIISFDTDYAIMQVMSFEPVPEGGDIAIIIRSPMSTAALKGAHEIQNLGAVETYERRYLWLAMLEVVEHDQVDSAPPAEADATPRPAKTKAKKTKEEESPPENLAPVVDDMSPFAEFNDEEGAKEVADLAVKLASGMYSKSMKSLIGFWKDNKAVLDELAKDYPEQFERVKKAFTETKLKLKKEQTDD